MVYHATVVNVTLINAIQIFHSLTADGSTQVSWGTCLLACNL